MPDRLLSVVETKDRLGVGKTKAVELILSGEIRSFLIGRRRLVPESAVDEFIARRAGEVGRRGLRAV